MTTLYLVRHAHAEWRPDEARPLSAQGRATAVVLADELAQFPITTVYSSPARRSLDTITPLADRLRLRPVVLADLRERDLTVPVGSTFDTAAARGWAEPAKALPGSESNAAAQARGLAVIRTILTNHRDSHVVVGTHGTLLALVLNGFDPLFGYDFWRRQTFPDVYEARFQAKDLVGVRRMWEEAA